MASPIESQLAELQAELEPSEQLALAHALLDGLLDQPAFVDETEPFELVSAVQNAADGLEAALET